jgi:predicted nucleic acid-binding protein
VKKIFLDTNIILDFLDNERPHYHDAVRLITTLTAQGWHIYISEDMMSTIFYLRKDPSQVLDFFDYILSHWHIVPYGYELMRKAVESARTHQADLEDTLQCLCAREHGCTLIVTEDRGFVTCGVEVSDYKGVLS